MSGPTQADIDKAQADLLGETPAAAPAEAAHAEAAPAKAAAPVVNEAERQFMALQKQNVEAKKESEGDLKDLAVMGGGAAGAYSQLYGRGLHLDLPEGPVVPIQPLAPAQPAAAAPAAVTPSPVDHVIERMNAEHAQRVAAVDAKLREITGDPNASSQNMTHEQIERALSGGPGPDAGTSGWQREDTKNSRSKSRSKVDSFFEGLHAQHGLDPNRPYYEAGDMVTLPSGIQVTAAEARRMADAKAAEAAALLRQHANDTAAHAQTVGALQQARDAQNAAAAQATADADARAAQENEARALRNQKRQANIEATKRGIGLGMRTSAGAIGGAGAAAQAYDIGKNLATKGTRPDTDQLLSLGGNTLAALGHGKGGWPQVVGLALNYPWLKSHRNEVAKSLSMGDVVPPVMQMSMSPEELGAPLNPYQRDIPPTPQESGVLDALSNFFKSRPAPVARTRP